MKIYVITEDEAHEGGRPVAAVLTFEQGISVLMSKSNTRYVEQLEILNQAEVEMGGWAPGVRPLALANADQVEYFTLYEIEVGDNV